LEEFNGETPADYFYKFKRVNALIVVMALVSAVKIETEVNHFETFSIVTFGTFLIWLT